MNPYSDDEIDRADYMRDQQKDALVQRDAVAKVRRELDRALAAVDVERGLARDAEAKLAAAEARIAELESAAKPLSDAEIEEWLDDFREVLIVEWGDSMPKSVSDVAASAVALMRRHDDRLTRLREWVEDEMRNDSWWRPVILAKIGELLAETKGGSDGV